MRTILLAIAAALSIGLFMPSGAIAASGDYDFSPGAGPGSSGRYFYDGRRGHRDYRRWRGNGYYLYVPSPRRYYNPRPRRNYQPSRSCAYWSDRCAANWGYGGANYRGCMKYYNCR